MNKIPELKLEFGNHEGAEVEENLLEYYIDSENNQAHLVPYNGTWCDDTHIPHNDDKDMFDVCNQHYNKLYHHFLKIADTQGLLTKEASLLLKPDNWIGWNSKYTDIIIGYDKYDNYYKIKCYMTNPDLWEVCISNNTYRSSLNSSEIAQQYCQNWLNEYLLDNALKEQK